MTGQRSLYVALIIATFAVSWAAILIRLCGAGPLPTAFYRMAMASAILAIPAIPKLKQAFKALSWHQIILLIISGIFLGLHFASWITSLFHTTISNSAVLVATSPVFVIALEALFLKDKIPAKSIIGIAVALAGIVTVSAGDFDLSTVFIKGDLLALAGAACAGVYLFAGRKLRPKMDILSYIFVVYSIAALTLLAFNIIYDTNLTDYPLNTWLIFLLLAIVPTVVGHSLYNWLLKFIPAHRVATTTLGEPIGASILAIFFFTEIPGWTTIIGGLLILAGIFVVLKRPSKLSSDNIPEQS